MEIRDNLTDRIVEAERAGWLAKVEGLSTRFTDRRPTPTPTRSCTGRLGVARANTKPASATTNNARAVNENCPALRTRTVTVLAFARFPQGRGAGAPGGGVVRRGTQGLSGWFGTWWRFLLLLLAGSALLAARIWLVSDGVLYGRTQVMRVDGVIAALAVLALAEFLHRCSEPGDRSAGGRWNIITAATGLLILLVSLVSLLSPVDEPGLPKAACTNAPTHGAGYIGITDGKAGNNSRTGPSRISPANGRFPANCAVGFSDYCLGDAIRDNLGSDASQEWATNRWLRVARHPSGWRGFLARHLSDEPLRDRFVSDAFIVPATNYEGLNRAGAKVCGSQTPAGKTTLRPFVRKPLPDGPEQTVELSATSAHAANIGFAVYLPPGQGFRAPGRVLPLYDPSLPAAENPGRIIPPKANSKAITWAYSDALRSELPAGRGRHPAEVLLMAIPCISDNLPDSTAKAALARYDITPPDVPRPAPLLLSTYDDETLATLARAACQANI